MCRDFAFPTMLLGALLLVTGVPANYQVQAPVESTVLLALLVGVAWLLFRDYRARILAPTRFAHLLAFFLGFLVLDHLVNLYCFLDIEIPVEFPWFQARPAWIAHAIFATTIEMLWIMVVNLGILGVLLRVLGSRQAWGLALRIVVYALPASLLVALPGAQSWHLALVAYVAAQVFTVWRLVVERQLDPARPERLWLE